MAGLSGSVATISEYSGRNRRPSPGSSVVYASVARTTVPAVTVPCVVTTRRGPISTAGVRSQMTTPWRSQASARPRTRRAGSMRALWGENDAPSAPCSRTRWRSSSRSSRRMSSSRRPRFCFPSTLARSRSSCGRENATASWPEWTKPQSISSVAATRPISVTVRNVSRSASSTAASPLSPPVHGRVGRDERRHPAAVAAGRAEAGDLALDHHHAQVGLQRLQVVGRPESRESRADDADVALDVA